MSARTRSLAVVAVSALTAIMLLVGVVVSLRGPVVDRPEPVRATEVDLGTAAEPGDQAQRDALANRPMRQFPNSYARPRPVSSRYSGRPIVLPPARSDGPEGVPTGFPRTPEGAMAQLIAIDRAAMQSGSLDGVREVIAAWAVPGGPTPRSWTGVAAMGSVLSGAGLPGDGSPSLSIVLTAEMGLVKGSVGRDFVVPCVDFVFEVTLNQTVRAAAADCQRMVWIGDRWMIGPGPEPAPGPTIWPDTDEAIDVGYRDVRDA